MEVGFPDTEGVDVVPAFQRCRLLFESHREPAQCDLAVDLEPVDFVGRCEITDSPADHILQPGVLDECRVDLEEQIVVGLAVVVEQHFDRAEALVENVEQLARVFLCVERLHSSPPEALHYTLGFARLVHPS